MELIWLVMLLGVCVLAHFLFPRKKGGAHADSDEPARLGRLGEDFIEGELKRKYWKFPVLKNIYVPYMGTTAEIDLVMIHEKGIFVFESKNYSGWIFGAADQPYWMQSFPNGEKRQFYNPIMQNRTHINALAQYLNLPLHCFHSCVVFSDRCTFKKVPQNLSFVAVTQHSGLLEQLRNMLSALPVKFQKAEIKKIRKRLSPLESVGKRVKEQHVRDILDAQSATVCPFCGGKLRRRKGPYGAYWACRDYPNCNYTRKIEKQGVSMR